MEVVADEFYKSENRFMIGFIEIFKFSVFVVYGEGILGEGMGVYGGKVNAPICT